MLKAYQRHGPTQAFGLVCSPGADSIFDGKHAYVPALEDILVWDVKKGQMIAMWHETGHRSEVTCALNSPRRNIYAVGYADGSLRLWDSTTGTVIVTFNGHKRAVTALAFDEQGSRIASASQDTDIILWDVEGETGLFRHHDRLRGHRGPITALRFIAPASSTSTSSLTSSGFLISTSRDTFMKLWDLTTQHCIQTVVAHQAEIWSMDVDPVGELIFTGSTDGELKAWSIASDALEEGVKANESGELTKIINPVGSLSLTSNHRVSQISFHPFEPYLAVQSHERSVEIFNIRTEEEIKKKRARKKQRQREKQRKKQEKEKETAMEEENDAPAEDGTDDIGLTDLFSSYLTVRGSGKIRSFDFVNAEVTKNGIQVLLALSSNALETYNIPRKPKTKSDELPEVTRTYSLDLPGHRTDIRTLSLSSTDELLASGSNGSLKIWNMRTTACIRTLDCEYAICSTFLPGDRHVLVGTKAGELLVYDLATSSLIQTVKAHAGTIWSVQVKPNKLGAVTGSADKEVKFWDFEYNVGPNADQDKPAISIVLQKTLKMTDDVLAVRYSPDGRFVAVALLDATVKVFHQDTLKFFLSLYGHKLPVLAMDISSDSKLIITCSADKNVKIWGLDFGDCHKSIFAHEESVMQVAFEKDSHYFWTVGKDKWVKYWDGDRFENIQKLDGHHGEIWALAVSNFGKFVVTGSHDKSIRVWEKLEDQLFLEEERERELEELYEKGVVDSMNRSNHIPNQEGTGDENGPTEAESTTVNKQTTDTLMAGEKIMEALEIADADWKIMQEYENIIAKVPPEEVDKVPLPTRHAILTAYDLDGPGYVLKVVQAVQSTALHDALLVLPFSKVVSLMTYLNEWAIKDLNTPLISRILFFLLRTHHHQIVSNRTMRGVLVDLRTHLRDALKRQKDEISYNLAALQYVRQQHEANRVAHFYEQEDM
ncbi:hypothetical protein M407DRAFT_225108 [Tulasnella calospora MUT 4182]|uniref:Small-subunit processome Utp12 domain-containing protein n=1 Tax=Tulasnella calospora MUT 4182 TaxID=1051891 RepID=A0A0C3QPL7_9AGAM|nr:hypothetical protein M407DRAFT_225108 [Tulasnella calospora MUT 4182]